MWLVLMVCGCVLDDGWCVFVVCACDERDERGVCVVGEMLAGVGGSGLERKA